MLDALRGTMLQKILRICGYCGLIPHDLKPDRIFRGITASTYAFVHGCTKSAGDGAL